MIHILGKIFTPLSTALDIGGKVLGLPPEVTNTAKIIANAATGNVIGVVDGGVSLAANLMSSAATTEYTSSSGPCAGYAQAPAADPRLQEFHKHLKTVEKGLSTIEDLAYGGVLFKDGLFAMCDLDMAIAHDKCPPELREACLFLKHNPDLFARLDTAAGIGKKDGIVGMADIRNAIYTVGKELETSAKPQSSPKPKPSSSAVSKPSVDCAPSTPPPKPQPKPESAPTSSKGTLDSNFLDYLEALRTLDANYRTYDASVGKLDEFLTRDNLRAIVKNPHASADLKAAAKFFLDHDEYYNRLEMSAGYAGRDGTVGWGDVKTAIAHAEQDLKKYGPPRSKSSTEVGASSGTSSSSLSNIINDPSLSLEEKIQQILTAIMDRADAEILSLTEQLSEAENKERSGKGENKGPSVQNLQLKLQQVMERRKQMFELMTNMSSKFNEMAKSAIQNLGRA
jgi:hypothetical protein